MEKPTQPSSQSSPSHGPASSNVVIVSKAVEYFEARFEVLKEAQPPEKQQETLTRLTQLEEDISKFLLEYGKETNISDILHKAQDLLKKVQQQIESHAPKPSKENAENSPSKKKSSSHHSHASTLQVWISGHETLYDNEKKQFVVYSLELMLGELQWTVKLRFSQFEQLNDELKRKYPQFIFPPLPPKKLFGNMSKDTTQQRLVMLQDYMQRILRNATLRKDETVLKFVDPHGHLASNESEDKPTEKTTEKTTEKITEKTTEKPVQTLAVPSSPSKSELGNTTQKVEVNTQAPTTSPSPTPSPPSNPTSSQEKITSSEPTKSIFDQIVDACKAEDFMAMKNLIERGAPINFVGKDVSGKVRISESPLGIVCQKGNSGLVTLLLQKGADVHLKDSLGQTVLHYVCSSKNLIQPGIVRQLVNAGANILENDLSNQTPLSLAQSLGMEAVFQGVDKKTNPAGIQEWVWNPNTKCWNLVVSTLNQVYSY